MMTVTPSCASKYNSVIGILFSGPRCLIETFSPACFCNDPDRAATKSLILSGAVFAWPHLSGSQTDIETPTRSFAAFKQSICPSSGRKAALPNAAMRICPNLLDSMSPKHDNTRRYDWSGLMLGGVPRVSNWKGAQRPLWPLVAYLTGRAAVSGLRVQRYAVLHCVLVHRPALLLPRQLRPIGESCLACRSRFFLL
jgi:hypothetical protein